MSYVIWKVEHTPYNNGWNPASTTTLTDCSNIAVNVSLGQDKDSFNCKLKNNNNKYDDFFKANDKITLYRVLNSTTITTSNLLMTAIIKDVPDEVAYNANDMKLEGYNFSESITSAIIFLEAKNMTCVDIIKQGLLNAQQNTNFQVTWDTSNDAAIASLTFPTLGYEDWKNKTLKDLIEKYTSNKYTGNGTFYWYVNNQNKLIWRPQINVASGIFDYEVDALKNYKDSKDKSSIKNFFILKGGRDPSSGAIQVISRNYSNIARNGQKFMLIISENNNSQDLIKQDQIKSFGKIPNDTNYPDLSSSTFTTAWVSGALENYTTTNYSINVVVGSAVTITGATESARKKAYVEVIRTEIQKRLQIEGEIAQSVYEYGKLKVDLSFPPASCSWGLGDVIVCYISKMNSPIKYMRVQSISYTGEGDTFTLQEDVGSI